MSVSTRRPSHSDRSAYHIGMAAVHLPDLIAVVSSIIHTRQLGRPFPGRPLVNGRSWHRSQIAICVRVICCSSTLRARCRTSASTWATVDLCMRHRPAGLYPSKASIRATIEKHLFGPAGRDESDCFVLYDKSVQLIREALARS